MARTREFDTDEAIAQIAEAFWAEGYEATGIAELVDATGVGRASLYGAFGSKREMLHRAIDFYLSHHIEDQWSPVDGGGLDGAKRMFGQFAYVLEAKPDRARMGCLLVNSAVELGRTDSEVVALSERYRTRMRDAFRSAYERAVVDGDMDGGHAEERAELSMLLLMGCFVSIKSGAPLEEIQRLTTHATDLIDSWRTPGS
ncbi:MAG: TetR/AcrR family transcriptional regulator [bacterium]|nr:TetR/AcrR family transcriptional regulator [bacterium]